jgi:Alginate export
MEPRDGDHSRRGCRRAGAIAVEAGFQPKLKRKPRLRWGYFYGAGDDNSYDGTHQTFFQVLPAARIYVRLPFYKLMNNQDAFAELILRPHPRWTIRTDAHILRLSNRNDLWYADGGAFQQTSFGYAGRPGDGSQSLSNVYDVSVGYQLNSQLTLSGYYAGATGRTVIEKIYPNGASGQFGYAELNWRF